MFPVSLSEYDLVNTTGFCSRGNGWGYRGQVETTEFGLPCQAWTSQTPHRHPRLPPHEVLGAGHACRNPWGLSHRPWCYTADPTRRWQYCNVPSCGEFYSDVIQSVLPSNHNLTVLHHTCNLGVSRVVLPRQQVAQRSGLAHCMVQGAKVLYRGVSRGKSPPPPNLKSCM